ncbi:HAMP domain-containing sensor histidine kinase [Clostridium cylindrosporum]|uniref:histidine kinase n=1 Tax=Clostridium cylindrosporum DSM 605 TaxID=1121307 RepID=A0A0J8DDS1_CLOCY|nr:HAMP domain-containing sensor histidine kinase [Clostridium cylindrosporum]KMT22384.1 sensor histidine kinase ResE [Clostridium cylindrosporum DSM 605]
MNQNKISIKWRIFGYLASFVGILLILLWLFQTVFLDDFYKSIKTRSIKSYVNEIAEHVDDSKLSSKLENISRENDMSVLIVKESGEIIYNTDSNPKNMLNKMTGDDIYSLYKKAFNNGGSTFQLFSREELKTNPFENSTGEKYGSHDRGAPLSMIYAKLVNRDNGSQAMIIASSLITPINSTVETLRVQLIYISLILILLSIVLAIFISRKISKPIININESAKKLAHGNYDTEFTGTGYLEIEELNDTLNYTARELSKVEDLRRELIANISHDLRTPLTMITGYAEVMRDIPGENTPENVQIIIDEARHLSTLVSDILDISKMQSGTQGLNISKFNITEAIREILKRYGKLIEKEGYSIEFLYDSDVYVNADEVKISQVIYNLINNAITYTGEDKKVIVSQNISSNKVKIEIVDTGQGIEEDMINHIWDRYYKSNKVHKRASIGTGLGLSIVKAVLEMHGAMYGVISETGKGSNFWFQLNLE